MIPAIPLPFSETLLKDDSTCDTQARRLSAAQIEEIESQKEHTSVSRS
jgi:hypothetical protein